MELITDIDGYDSSRPGLVLGAGTFDGVHIGHQRIIAEVVSRALARTGTAGVMTFDPHPREVLKPSSEISLLATTDKKIELIAGLGVDVLFLLQFTRELAAYTPERFVRDILVEKLHVEEVVFGYDYRFGVDRSGDYIVMTRLGRKYGFSVDEISPLQVDDVTVSSTEIRECILGGDLDRAEHYLGRKHAVVARVTTGRGIGDSIGFPTANIEVEKATLPPDGVYAATVKVDDRVYAGALNIGVNPTVAQTGERTAEVHLVDFDGELYGKTMEVTMVERLRDEVKFDTIEELAAQIEKDIEAAKSAVALSS
jgi:riboflavin kinase/FMN adenylyltransferase